MHTPDDRPRKPRDRDAPQPTDLAERMIALQRKNAAAVPPRRPRDPPAAPPAAPAVRRERPDRSPVSPRPPVPKPSPRKHAAPAAADHEDFSRRLKISESPAPRAAAPSSKQASKLFNPETDPIPMRRTAEPESISDATSSSYAPRIPNARRDPPRDAPPRQLFDHRKDDPVRFAVLARPHGRPTPTPKSSGDYISASSTSSYANSVTSSSFTLSSTTDGSSASSAIFDRPSQSHDEPSKNVFAVQLKNLYRAITELETEIKKEDADDPADDSSRILLKHRGLDDDELEKEKWKKQISDHKRLAEIIHNLLEISLAPSVPASLRNIPKKYNIIIRLWSHAFHKLLESLRRASFTSPLALEHLQDFIYYAYTFYTGLLEEPTLNSFKGGWLEALGDLARYRMAVAHMVNGPMTNGNALTAAAVCKAAADSTDPAAPPPTAAAPPAPKSVSDAPAARIDDSPSPSIGIAAARLLDVEPETERWRCIARDWYGAGLTDTPGMGKLHHHLGLLSREVESEELQGVYHFVKSMTTLHPFMMSRESVLPIWSAESQTRRALPDARVTELFVLLHGMLFTNIQLDDFQPTLARLIERLEIDGAEEREWVMMGVINIGAVLEYGKPSGVLRKTGGVGTREAGAGMSPGMRVMAKRVAADEEKMDVDEEPADDAMTGVAQISPAQSEAEGDAAIERPAPFRLALQLAFAMLTHVLRRPLRKATPFARSALNPYLTVLLTFLATVLQHAATRSLLERSVPWDALAALFATVPRNVMAAQGLAGAAAGAAAGERWSMLTSGCAPPLPEDWCLRGMEWVGRRVFERGFWKAGEERRAELEVLDLGEGGDGTDGHIEDDDDEEEAGAGGAGGEMTRRWVRIVRSAVGIAGSVPGFKWVEGTREWKVEGVLAEKAARWSEEDRVEREAEERRRMGTRWADDSMEVDEGADEMSGSDEEDDDADTVEVKALKARRKYLRNMLQSAQRGAPASPPRRPRPRASRKDAPTRAALSIVPGYTILVVDTNILLSSLPMFASVVESLLWTVIVPLPVIMELDGLSSSASSQLAEAAQAAMAYIQGHIRSHTISLKVQTSRGNYLPTLSVRAEQTDFAEGNAERSMDDLILKAAIWQDEHWVDRSAMLKSAPRNTEGAVKVVLLSLDRNLRLKARSRQLPAASETDLAYVLATGT